MTSKELLAQFRRMWGEHWAYVWGAAQEGAVDCSGAFVYAFRLYGLQIAHGSNSIARKHITGNLLPISKAKPGMIAFKCRPWAEDQKSNKWYGSVPGDIYHVGLVDEDPAYVLNAKGKESGFSRDPLKGYSYVAYLKNVNYSEVEPMPTPTSEKIATVVLPSGVTGTNVFLRPQPNTKKWDARVPVGDRVTILEDQGEWCKITWSGKTGYMMSNYLEYDGQGDETASGLAISPDDAERIDQALKAIETAVDIIGGIVGRG